jgi:2-aminoadipate transaminase
MKYYEFTGGKPPPESFPVQELMASAQRVLENEGRNLVFYPGQHAYAGYSNNGYLGLREVASSRFEHREGVPLPVENIAITAGSMQAIELIGRHFITPGDTVLTSELCYVGTLRFLRYLRAKIVGIPLDYQEGMDMEALETTLGKLAAQQVTPKFIYVTDSHQNPTGAILSEQRRKRLLELGAQYNVPISKILGPGLRLGCFCAPDKYLSDILVHRWDAGTSTLSCMIVADFLKRQMWPHIAKHVAIIKKKRDTLLQTLDEHLAGVATWTKPRGGLFDWITLPDTIDLQQLAKLTEEQGVVYSPGQVFHWNNDVIKHLRLSYTHMSLDDIRDGVTILARCIKEAS